MTPPAPGSDSPAEKVIEMKLSETEHFFMILLKSFLFYTEL